MEPSEPYVRGEVDHRLRALASDRDRPVQQTATEYNLLAKQSDLISKSWTDFRRSGHPIGF